MIIIHQFLTLQLDIDNAFVQSNLAEYIYAIPGRPLPPGKCYRLNCALYGLNKRGEIGTVNVPVTSLMSLIIHSLEMTYVSIS